jgi:hypothetical protein
MAAQIHTHARTERLLVGRPVEQSCEIEWFASFELEVVVEFGAPEFAMV